MKQALQNGFMFLKTGYKDDSPQVAYTLNIESVKAIEEKGNDPQEEEIAQLEFACTGIERVTPDRIIEYAYGKEKQRELDRAKTLLKATWELLNKQENSGYVLNLLSETVNYDDAECDGNCLMEDISAWFDEFYGEDLECGD